MCSDGGLYTDRITIWSGVDIFTATTSQGTLMAIFCASILLFTTKGYTTSSTVVVTMKY